MVDCRHLIQNRTRSFYLQSSLALKRLPKPNCKEEKVRDQMKGNSSQIIRRLVSITFIMVSVKQKVDLKYSIYVDEIKTLTRMNTKEEKLPSFYD